VWASRIVVANPFPQHSTKVPLVERDQKIQALAAHGPNQPFAKRIGLWRLRRSAQHSYSDALHQFLIDFRRENRIAIMDHKAMRILAGQCLAKLLQRPLGRRMSSDIAVQNPP
jgi:hypothetical protein